MKFGADIFIQFGVIDILSKIKDGGRQTPKTHFYERNDAFWALIGPDLT